MHCQPGVGKLVYQRHSFTGVSEDDPPEGNLLEPLMSQQSEAVGVSLHTDWSQRKTGRGVRGREKERTVYQGTPVSHTACVLIFERYSDRYDHAFKSNVAQGEI